MPTADRPEFVRNAIECFERQTYPARELVILDSGIVDSRWQASPLSIYRKTTPKLVGALRNECVEMAHGDYIAHWDDDDLSHPRRLEEQMQAITRTQGALVGYHSMYFLNEDAEEAWLYRGWPRYAVGSSFFYKRSVALANRFPLIDGRGKPLLYGEDNGFLWSIDAATVWTCDAEDRMIARTHATNTCPRPTDNPNQQSYTRADYGTVANIAASYGISPRRDVASAPGSRPGDEPDSPGRPHRAKRTSVPVG